MAGEISENRSLPGRIREAVASGEFSKARLLWAEYGEHFCSELQQGPLPQSRLTEARELAEWTRMAALCARAHTQARLNQIAVARKYGCPGPRSESKVAASF